MQNDKSKCKINKKFKKNILLRDYTTFKIGGPAKYFFEAKNKEALVKAINWAKESKVPFFVLGGGSNLLVSDEGFDGLVIKIENQNISILNDRPKLKQNENVSRWADRPKLTQKESQIVEVGAGVKLADLVELSLKEGLTGLEWAAGIPEATVGGAIKVQAAAFNSSMRALVKKVETFEGIILSALLCLKKRDKKEIKKQINYVFNYRKKNHPMELPSAGCIFKNSPNISAGRLIEQCGLKGKRIGGAQISEKHANFIVNLDDASSRDVLALINLAKKEVKAQFSIELQEEVQYLGF